MQSSPLQGRTILVIEDEPLIAMDIAADLESAGANVTTTTTLHHALILAEHDGLSADIVDPSLGDENSSALYARLKQRGIPFLIYSGYPKIEGVSPDVPHLLKPALPDVLVAAVIELIAG